MKKFSINSISLMLLGYPFSEKKLCVKNELVWLGFSIDFDVKFGISESERRFALEKAHLLSKLGNH